MPYIATFLPQFYHNGPPWLAAQLGCHSAHTGEGHHALHGNFLARNPRQWELHALHSNFLAISPTQVRG